MITIGLGNAGIHICRKLSNLGKYKTIELHGGKGLPECQTHEEYEASVPKLGNKLRLGKDQNIWLIVCGAARVSGTTLAILEQIKDREVKVMYIVPDSFFMSATQKKQHRVVFNVLQEYARSGMIHSLWLVDNKEATKKLHWYAYTHWCRRMHTPTAWSGENAHHQLNLSGKHAPEFCIILLEYTFPLD